MEGQWKIVQKDGHEASIKWNDNGENWDLTIDAYYQGYFDSWQEAEEEFYEYLDRINY